MNQNAKDITKAGCGCLGVLFLIPLTLFLLFSGTYGQLALLLMGIFWWLIKRNKKVKQKETLKGQVAKYYKRVEKRCEMLNESKSKFDKNSDPHKIKQYKDITMEIYNLPQHRVAVRIRTWDGEVQGKYDSLDSEAENLASDALTRGFQKIAKEINEKHKRLNNLAKDVGLNNFYFGINEAKKAIDVVRSWLPPKEEYLAEREKEVRKKENIHFLAKAYQQRKNSSSFKKNLALIDNLFNLTPTEFEQWVKEHIFEKEGWRVSETKKTGDGGIDLILWKNNEKSIAQCKRFRKTVGEPLVRDFYGTMMSEGVSRGYFVTTGLFSLPALKFAEDKPIEMIDRRILAQKYAIASIQHKQ